MESSGAEEVGRVRTPRQGEVICVAESLLGSNKVSIRCEDGKVRIGRIPGRLKKRMWIKPGNVVLAEPWKIQGDSRADIVWKYTNAQADWLRRKGFLRI